MPPHISPHLPRSCCFHWSHLHLWKEYLCWTLFKWPNLNVLFPATTLTSTETMRSLDMSWVGYLGRRTRLSADHSDLNFERNVNTFFSWAGKAEHKSHLCLHIYSPLPAREHLENYDIHLWNSVDGRCSQNVPQAQLNYKPLHKSPVSPGLRYFICTNSIGTLKCHPLGLSKKRSAEVIDILIKCFYVSFIGFKDTE